MKTDLLKMLLSAFAFLLAIAFSFLSFAYANKGDKGPVQQGYIHSSEKEPCELSIRCDSRNTGIICTTSNGTRVWGKETPGSTVCTVTLYGAEEY